MNKYFYAKLEEITDFKLISNNTVYTKVPDDWYIIATDIKNSTKAIEDNKYKEVNMVGALTIISVLNINKSLEIPFIFGGDGAFLLIPKDLYSLSQQALLAIEQLSLNSYGLELRVGIIPVKTIYSMNKQLLISKFKISKDYSQAMVKGGGLELADTLLKSNSDYSIKEPIDKNFQVNIDGLECRWEAIPSPKDETLCIIIKCRNETHYETVLNRLDDILGKESVRHPIVSDNLTLSFKNKDLDIESSLFNRGVIQKQLSNLKLKFINLLGFIFMYFNLGQWASYKKRILSTTDTEKFDDILRMVVCSYSDQTKVLQEYLEEEYEKEELVYGIHRSDSALMTCLVFERHGRHIHFVDSSNGGYAMAAKMFKKRQKLKV